MSSGNGAEVNQLRAFRDKVALAAQRGMPELPSCQAVTWGLDYLRRMATELAEGSFSP